MKLTWSTFRSALLPSCFCVMLCSVLLAPPAHGQIIQEECAAGIVAEPVECGYTGCYVFNSQPLVCTPQEEAKGACYNDQLVAAVVTECCSIEYENWEIYNPGSNPCAKEATGPTAKALGGIHLADDSRARVKTAAKARPADESVAGVRGGGRRFPGPGHPLRYVYLLDCRGAYDLALVPRSP